MRWIFWRIHDDILMGALLLPVILQCCWAEWRRLTTHICQGHYERYPNKKIAIFFRSITINCIHLLSVIFRQTVWGGEAGSMAKIFSSAKDMNDNPEQESWPKIWTTRHERARADPTWPYHQTIVHGLYISYISSFLYISYISYLYISSWPHLPRGFCETHRLLSCLRTEPTRQTEWQHETWELPLKVFPQRISRLFCRLLVQRVVLPLQRTRVDSCRGFCDAPSAPPRGSCSV